MIDDLKMTSVAAAIEAALNSCDATETSQEEIDAAIQHALAGDSEESGNIEIPLKSVKITFWLRVEPGLA